MIKAKNLYVNLSSEELIRIALEKGEGRLADNGALVVETGKFTGRSPDDKFIVDDELTHDTVAWGKVNRPTAKKTFNDLKKRLLEYLEDKDVYVFKGFAGADKNHKSHLHFFMYKSNAFKP